MRIRIFCPVLAVALAAASFATNAPAGAAVALTISPAAKLDDCSGNKSFLIVTVQNSSSIASDLMSSAGPFSLKFVTPLSGVATNPIVQFSAPAHGSVDVRIPVLGAPKAPFAFELVQVGVPVPFPSPMVFGSPVTLGQIFPIPCASASPNAAPSASPGPKGLAKSMGLGETPYMRKVDERVAEAFQSLYVVSNLSVTGVVTYGCVDKTVTCTSGQAELRWSAPSRKVDGYNIYGIGYPSSGVPINRVKVGSTTATRYVLNSTNCYVVAAYSGNHVFFDSEKICAVMPPRARGAALEVPFAGQAR